LQVQQDSSLNPQLGGGGTHARDARHMEVPSAVASVQAKHVHARLKHAPQGRSPANRRSQRRYNFCSGHEETETRTRSRESRRSREFQRGRRGCNGRVQRTARIPYQPVVIVSFASEGIPAPISGGTKMSNHAAGTRCSAPVRRGFSGPTPFSKALTITTGCYAIGVLQTPTTPLN
jgi:hypothetical protein